jgi:hypothetical protein
MTVLLYNPKRGKQKRRHKRLGVKKTMARKKHYRKHRRVVRRRKSLVLLNPRRRRHVARRHVGHYMSNPRRRRHVGRSMGTFKGMFGNIQSSMPAIFGGVGGFVGNKLAVKYLGTYLPAGAVRDYVPRVVALVAVPWLLSKVSQKAAAGAMIGSGIELANYALTSFGVYSSLGLAGLEYNAGNFQGLSYNPSGSFQGSTFTPSSATPLRPFGAVADRFEKRY